MQDFFQQIARQFAQTSWLEWLGTLTGFLCVYLAAKQNIWNWPISIISVASYAILFYDAKLYGDTVLQFYFLSTAVYGWYYWIKRKEEKKGTHRQSQQGAVAPLPPGHPLPNPVNRLPPR
ncbi:nicotinamide mononucleotide transporter PnuC [Sphingobacterium zeae]|uniref:Nicotinamide riboside transporter PnuC n=1 Tax=Sphingobacterium zeae TaxID=1776859 RepID=A0ABU0UCA2_9SPHI|nr:nicotinamide mononucleotide transporter PnuC [Sphingobacterium zeae]